jgi:hypothetical protein
MEGIAVIDEEAEIEEELEILSPLAKQGRFVALFNGEIWT